VRSWPSRAGQHSPSPLAQWRPPAPHITPPSPTRVRLVNRQIKTVNRKRDALVEQMIQPDAEPGQLSEQHDATILRSLPGVGRIVLATLLAEAHHALRARDYHALRTLTGVAPVTKRSGESCPVEMLKACAHGLRTAVYHRARVARLRVSAGQRRAALISTLGNALQRRAGRRPGAGRSRRSAAEPEATDQSLQMGHLARQTMAGGGRLLNHRCDHRLPIEKAETAKAHRG